MDKTKLMKLVPLNYENLIPKIDKNKIKKIIVICLKLSKLIGFKSEIVDGSSDSITELSDYIFNLFDGEMETDEKFIEMLVNANVTSPMIDNIKVKSQIETRISTLNRKCSDLKEIVNKRKLPQKSRKNSIKIFAPRKNILKFKNSNWVEASDSE
jgi:hypothetical protein